MIATTHPKVTFLHQLDRDELPDDFVTAIERWKSRSGTVKVNLALDRLPAFTSHPEPSPDVYGGTIVLAPSLDHVEQAFQDAVGGRAASRPFADICIPSVFDRTLAPEGHHVMSMFTQWVPSGWSAEPHRDELDAYADRVIAQMEEVAPGFTSSILHRQVIGPYDMEHTYGLVGGNIFHGELSTGQLFHMRPVPGYADHRTPIAGLYMAGSATHGGGGVTGIPALNVVAAIAHDRRARRLHLPAGREPPPGADRLLTSSLPGRCILAVDAVALSHPPEDARRPRPLGGDGLFPVERPGRHRDRDRGQRAGPGRAELERRPWRDAQRDTDLEGDHDRHVAAQPHLAVPAHDEPQLLHVTVLDGLRGLTGRQLEVGHAAPLAPHQHPDVGTVGRGDVGLGREPDAVHDLRAGPRDRLPPAARGERRAVVAWRSIATSKRSGWPSMRRSASTAHR